MRKFAAMLATIALTLGLFGAAISATFTDQAIAQQQINLGSFGVGLASDTPGAQVSPDGKTLTCPIIVPASSALAWDLVGCHVQITSVGTFAPTSVKLYAQATTAGSVNLAHFMAQFNEGAGSWSPNMFGETPMLSTFATKTLVSTTTVVPADVYTNLGWLNLDNGDLNSIVLMTYTIEANG